ncbi:transcription antitermination factor NusB [Dehalogenimonas sp. 4OHTPN]|uniref:Transcription antitermination protein NusB n=1 Tax=Dehalogenimonas sp. 4OHTPN TaxID=3166643 RepID=A0AAU8G9J3_9CHLR
MTKRHEARVLALKVLYEADIARHDAAAVLDRQIAGADLPAENDVFTRALVEGALKHQAEADGIITRLAPAYPVSQLSPIDRNVLRLAIYELFHDNNVPVRVAINEAVELAKEFGSESSAKFVNGVLSSVATLVQRD